MSNDQGREWGTMRQREEKGKELPEEDEKGRGENWEERLAAEEAGGESSGGAQEIEGGEGGKKKRNIPGRR